MCVRVRAYACVYAMRAYDAINRIVLLFPDYTNTHRRWCGNQSLERNYTRAAAAWPPLTLCTRTQLQCHTQARARASTCKLHARALAQPLKFEFLPHFPSSKRSRRATELIFLECFRGGSIFGPHRTDTLFMRHGVMRSAHARPHNDVMKKYEVKTR